MNIPTELRYTKDHEWAQIEGRFSVCGYHGLMLKAN
jgi:glycine cleavage system H lipoate-binding protein